MKSRQSRMSTREMLEEHAVGIRRLITFLEDQEWRLERHVEGIRRILREMSNSQRRSDTGLQQERSETGDRT